MQQSADLTDGEPKVKYAPVDIDAEGISFWGRCHKRMGRRTVVLKNSDECFRCFHLRLRSHNVLQLFTSALERCYTREEAAVASCPTETHIRFREATQLLLFRVPEDAAPTPCPFAAGSSSYGFTYSRHLDYPNPSERCTQSSSKLSPCPSSSSVALNFTGCSFSDRAFEYRCLGSWTRKRGFSDSTAESYVALMDVDAAEKRSARPIFRCGLYRHYPNRTLLTLSRDSTCEDDLYSASLGFETHELRPIPAPPWPAMTTKGSCSFPSWLQGDWEDMSVAGKIMTHREVISGRGDGGDSVVHQTFTSHCVEQSPKHRDYRYLIYSRSQCGEEQYNCVWLKRRSANVIELQFGRRPSTVPTFGLCDNEHFLQRTWRTQGRRVPVKLASCPIAGDFSGNLPDAPRRLCARMSSDCNNPDVIFYSVFACSDPTQVLEEREYTCVGQWREEGLLYAYVRRTDLDDEGGSAECFVARAAAGNGSSDDEVFLMEGGRDCRRGLKVEEYGMRLTKQSSCNLKLPKSGPWYIPLSRGPTSSPDGQPSGDGVFVPGLNVIREQDLEDLSQKPRMPMTDNSSCRSYDAFPMYLVLFLTFVRHLLC